jgi:hypothetical protein
MENITLEAMCAAVEDYIYKKKNVRVRIEISYHPFFIQRQVDMVHWCYNFALMDLTT